MFRSQFFLTVREEKGLRELWIFFTKAWYATSLLTEAPNNDLQLLKFILLQAYSSVNPAISKAGWRMAFFDNSVFCETNDKMVRAVEEVEVEKAPLKNVTLNVISVAQLENKSVADFVTRHIKSSYSCQHHSWQRIMTIRLLQLLPVLLQLLMTLLSEV